MISDSNTDMEINVKYIIYIMNMQKVYKIQIINQASVASFRWRSGTFCSSADILFITLKALTKPMFATDEGMRTEASPRGRWRRWKVG